MKNERFYKIGNNLDIPWIFFGTGVIWKYSRNPKLFLKTNIKQILSSVKHFKMNKELYSNIHVSRILEEAYNSGFRGFDTGRIYGYSEKMIGKLYTKHDDIWINTKCSVMDIERKQSPATLEENLAISKANLRVNEINSLLLHWPEGGGDKWIDIYKDIIEECKKGSVRIFGISNARLEDLSLIQEKGLPLPMLIQNEIHPMNVQKEIRVFCKAHTIQLMAHTPTTRMRQEVTTNETLISLAKKYAKSIAQIIIRWHYQNDVIPIVNTTSKEHMKQNLDIFNFELTDEEMALIDAQDKKLYLITAKGIDDPKYVFNR